MTEKHQAPQITMPNTPKISVVIPVMNEEGSIAELVSHLAEVFGEIGTSWEVLFVDDGSNDGTRDVLGTICDEREEVCAILLRRNFGKAMALQAGFDHARGELIFTMDGDLQDDPKEIPRFLEEIEAGADLVSGWKQKRHDPLSKTLPSKIFNSTVSVVTGLKLHDYNCGFKCYRREVLDEIHLYGELHRFTPALAHARGFRVKEIAVTHHPRNAGKSKYGIARLPKGFFDLLTVLLTTRYRDRPLHFIGGAGLSLFTVGSLILAYLSVGWFMGQGIGARPLFFLGILLVILGVQMVTTGLVAEMITKAAIQEARGYSIKRAINLALTDESQQ